MTKTVLYSAIFLFYVGTFHLIGCIEPVGDVESQWKPDSGDDLADTNGENEFVPIKEDYTLGSLCNADAGDYFNNAYSPFMGGEQTTDLVVVIYSYFKCSACALFAKNFRELWQNNAEYKNRVKVYFHHYPFNYEPDWEFHVAVYAAGLQGNDIFWSIHDFVFNKIATPPSEFSDLDDLRKYLDTVLYIDMEKWEADRNDPLSLSFVSWDKNQILPLNPGGTPTIYMCGKNVNWGQVERKVNDYLGIEN